MLEIELKFRIDDWTAAMAKLQQLGGKLLATQHEADHYFNGPDRNFRDTDEVFRLRCVGDSAILTYKGPKRAGPVKSRTEIELPLVAGTQTIADALSLLVALRYRPVTVVNKKRTLFSLNREGFELHICFDELAAVGQFVEVEIVAEEGRLAHAETVVKSVAAELGLTTPEPRAYLRMVLEAQGVE